MSRIETWKTKEDALKDLIKASDHIPDTCTEDTQSWLKSKQQFDEACRSYEPISLFDDENDDQYESEEDILTSDDKSAMNNVKQTLHKIRNNDFSILQSHQYEPMQLNHSSESHNFASDDSDVDLSFVPIKETPNTSTNIKVSMKRQISPQTTNPLGSGERKKRVCDFIKESFQRKSNTFSIQNSTSMSHMNYSVP